MKFMNQFEILYVYLKCFVSNALAHMQASIIWHDFFLSLEIY